jgi:hypothetical protein
MRIRDLFYLLRDSTKVDIPAHETQCAPQDSAMPSSPHMPDKLQNKMPKDCLETMDPCAGASLLRNQGIFANLSPSRKLPKSNPHQRAIPSRCGLKPPTAGLLITGRDPSCSRTSILPYQGHHAAPKGTSRLTHEHIKTGDQERPSGARTALSSAHTDDFFPDRVCDSMLTAAVDENKRGNATRDTEPISVWVARA